MDHDHTTDGESENAPLFDAFRRGYDPEQVDRYLADQERILDEAKRRADDAEQRLNQAMGQLRAMNKRIADLEQGDNVLTSINRNAQSLSPSVPLDILGDRVQRIVQEAWDGAFALRQSVESEIGLIREQAIDEAQAIVDGARSKARSIEEQMRRRRDAYLQRVEQDKSKAVAQMTFLSDQRKGAVAELLAIKERIEAAIMDVPTQTAANLSLVDSPVQSFKDLERENRERAAEGSGDETRRSQHLAQHPSSESKVLHFDDADLPPTLPVEMLQTSDSTPRPADTSSLVRSHREATAMRRTNHPSNNSDAIEARIFDFEAETDH